MASDFWNGKWQGERLTRGWQVSEQEVHGMELNLSKELMAGKSENEWWNRAKEREIIIKKKVETFHRWINNINISIVNEMHEKHFHTEIFQIWDGCVEYLWTVATLMALLNR